MKKVLCSLAAVVIAFSATSCVTTGSGGSCCGSCGGDAAKTECCGSCGGGAKTCSSTCSDSGHKH